jgi:hypothetical protein
MRDPDGNLVAACETKDTAHMILMFMGDDNAGELFWIDVKMAEARFCFSQPKTTIKHHLRFRDA